MRYRPLAVRMGRWRWDKFPPKRNDLATLNWRNANCVNSIELPPLFCAEVDELLEVENARLAVGRCIGDYVCRDLNQSVFEHLI